VGKDCFAYKMAQRLRGRYGYPEDNPFRVTFHPGRLKEPCEVKKPSKIFVGSMGEMFCGEVKYGWLGLVFCVMERCPQHTFQTLTKQPDSVIPLLPENLWFGVSVTGLNDEWRIDRLLDIEATIRFISFEPLLGPVDLESHSLAHVDWVIIGKLTGSKRVKLRDEWVDRVFEEARKHHIPVFMKNNLSHDYKGLYWMQEFPKGD